MQLDEIERELKDTENTLRAANDCFAKEQFPRAYDLYKQALSRLTQTFGAEDSRTISCLLSLGDTCYTLEKFEEAARSYHQALTIKERSGQLQDHEYPRALFKLARAYARVKPNEADKYFTRATQSARQCLLAGDPLLGKILEAHATFLNVVGRTAEAETLRDEARLNRHKFGSTSQVVERYLEPLVGQTTIPPGKMFLNKSSPDQEGFTTLQLRAMGRPRDSEPIQPSQPAVPLTPAPQRARSTSLIAMLVLGGVLATAAGATVWKLYTPPQQSPQPASVSTTSPPDLHETADVDTNASPDLPAPPEPRPAVQNHKVRIINKLVRHNHQSPGVLRAAPKKSAPAAIPKNQWQDLKEMRHFD
ncbi:MAG TPA: tetratricopeptide repeat protein [Trichormus sp.]